MGIPTLNKARKLVGSTKINEEKYMMYSAIQRYSDLFNISKCCHKIYVYFTGILWDGTAIVVERKSYMNFVFLIL